MLDATLRAADTGRAMSQENVDRALELLDAFNRRDLDAFVALTDDEIEVESPTRCHGGRLPRARGTASLVGGLSWRVPRLQPRSLRNCVTSET